LEKQGDVSMNSDATLIPLERIQGSIIQFRGERVMLDADLATLFGVETGALTRAVWRNIERFLSISCSSFPKKNLVS